MKSTFLTVAAAALLLTPTLRAEDKPADKPAGDKPAGERGRGPGGPGGGRGQFTPEDRLKAITERLGLTPEQAEKVKAIYAKNADAMKAFREKGRENITPEDRTKMQEIMKAEGEEIKAVLTPEQVKKQEEARARFGGGEGRRRGPGGDKPPGEKPPGDAPKPEAK